VDFPAYLPPPGPPVLVTLHLPPAFYASAAWAGTRPDTHLVCVSRSQRQACPPGAAVRAVVPNGVPLDRYRPGRAKGAYAVALGRVCPEKGFEVALDAAARAGVPLLLAGRVFGYPEHRAYFEREVRPRLSGPGRFLGPIGGERKRALLAGARCLLVPSRAPETSSLVAMEALACGTPVIAFPVGALPELIEPGRTGFLVRSEAEMAEAIRQVGRLAPADCRRAAEARCAAGPMLARYLDLYAELAATPPAWARRRPAPAPLPGPAPRWVAGAAR
jgi:glycosyltransferase involved in cell wall biosynthesis